MIEATQSPGPGRTGRPSKAEAEAVEGRLLDAAESLFMEHGFAGASVGEIAARANASKQTIYLRYATKERLFEAVVARALERFLASFDRRITGRSVEARIRNLVLLFVERTLDPQSLRLMRVLIAEGGRLGELSPLIDRTAQARIEQFVVESGVLDPIVDPARGLAVRALAARQLIDLTVNPLVLRALLGADVQALRRDAARTVKASVALFVRGFAG